MTDLIDRYIHQVGRYLPRKNRTDIQAELRSSLLDSLDADQAGEFHEEKVVALLKQFGSPEKVAASYASGNQYLIGPALYPLFRMVVGIVTVALIGALLLAQGIPMLVGQAPLAVPQPLVILDIIMEILGAALTAFGMTVLIFAILQRFGVQPDTPEEDWDPRSLPPIDDSETVSYAGTIVEIAFALLLLAILWLFPDKIGFVAAWGEPIIVNPVIVSIIPLISVSLLLGIGLDLVILRKRRWGTGARIAKIGVNLFSLYVLYQLIIGHSAWLAGQGQSGFFSSLEAISDGVMTTAEWVPIIGMQAFRLAFTVALIVISIETIGLAYRLIVRAIAPSPAPSD